MRFVTSIVVLLLIVLSSGSAMRAQTCGGSFAKFVVLDSKEMKVPDVTIELVAELPREEYLKLKARKGYIGYGDFSPRLTPPEVEELVARAGPGARDTDFCGNPLMQRANSTRVRNPEDRLNHRDGSIENFGFCTSEVFSRVYLLKISAPGYVTDYYMGSYLGGCAQRHSFVLNRLPDTKLNQSQKPTADGNAGWIDPARATGRELSTSSANRFARPANATG